MFSLGFNQAVKKSFTENQYPSCRNSVRSIQSLMFLYGTITTFWQMSTKLVEARIRMQLPVPTCNGYAKQLARVRCRRHPGRTPLLTHKQTFAHCLPRGYHKIPINKIRGGRRGKIKLRRDKKRGNGWKETA